MKHANYTTSHKNNCQKIQPAHTVITKRDFILRGSCFFEKYSFTHVRGPTVAARYFCKYYSQLPAVVDGVFSRRLLRTFRNISLPLTADADPDPGTIGTDHLLASVSYMKENLMDCNVNTVQLLKMLSNRNINLNQFIVCLQCSSRVKKISDFIL